MKRVPPADISPAAPKKAVIPKSAAVLGIETSCDETAAAVLQGGQKLLSSVVSSQVALHEKYGGVVPELASRQHLVNLYPVIEEALKDAAVDLRDIDAVAVTRGPGLVGALLVGLSMAKGLAHGLQIPFLGVNHLEGHLLSPLLERRKPSFPYIALLVSGGHSALYYLQGIGSYRMLGMTRDDAVGEAYDKVARLLGLGYPGGPIVDRLAARGDPEAWAFPRALKGSLDFSFSGLKTAVSLRVQKLSPRGETLTQGRREDICAAFQAACTDTLVDKTLRAARKMRCRDVVVTGGVAANRGLRREMDRACLAEGRRVFFPAREFCTDNAAMIALAGYHRLRRGERSAPSENALAVWMP